MEAPLNNHFLYNKCKVSLQVTLKEFREVQFDKVLYKEVYNNVLQQKIRDRFFENIEEAKFL